jgi:hypothetical protein
MAAPLGFKTFNTGDVLSAADTNGYLMQGVLVFADAAARSAAITSPQEGQSSYLKDTDVIQVYSGSAWVTKSGGSSPLTTKGDIYVYGTGDTRLPVGTDTYTLVADSAEATGLKWAAPASGGGMTLLNSGGTALSGSSVTINVTTTGYTELTMYIENAYASADNVLGLRINGDTASNYSQVFLRTGVTDVKFASQGYYRICEGMGTSNAVLTNTNIEISIFNPTSTSQMQIGHSGMNGPSGDIRFSTGRGVYDCSAVVSSITFITLAGTFSGGTAFIYGVK